MPHNVRFRARTRQNATLRYLHCEKPLGDSASPNAVRGSVGITENFDTTPSASRIGAHITKEVLLVEVNQECEVQIPKSGICPTQHKYAETVSIPISAIEYEQGHSDSEPTKKLHTAVNTPWGQILRPVFVSKIENSTNDKQWKLWDGISRIEVANHLKLSHVMATVVEGTEEEIRMKIHEQEILRPNPNAYEQMKQFAEFSKMLVSTYEQYSAGGNQAKKAAEKKAQGLPPITTLIENVTGLGKTAFYSKVNAYNGLASEYHLYLEKNPDCLTAKKDKWLKMLADTDYNKKTDPKQIVKYLPKMPDPTAAYFQSVRDNAAAVAETLPPDKMFPVYNEPFWENAKRIKDGSVQLIATDPNWELAEDEEEGEFWIENGIKVAPKLTKKHWEQFGELAAQRLAISGHVVVLVGGQYDYDIETILRKYLRRRWKMGYVHPSGLGTPARKSGMASRQRTMLLFQRQDAPEMSGKYKQFIADVVGEVPKLNNTPDRTIALLEAEKYEIERRIAELKATGYDSFTEDLIITALERGKDIKKFHYWQQDISAWREIIRRFSKPGDFVWEPFSGSGTTGIAAVTCKDWYLDSKGNWKEKLQPRIGIGCDAMKMWADVSKFRIWEAQKDYGLIAKNESNPMMLPAAPPMGEVDVAQMEVA
jgi:hypothetical protein